MQLRGSFRLKLTPRQKCRNTCSSIVDTLNESEICMYFKYNFSSTTNLKQEKKILLVTVIINSDLWSLHYKPLTNEISLAIITENEL